jgi:hypothetical protein
MDRLGYYLGDCSGDHVLASSSFGVTKVVARRKDEDICHRVENEVGALEVECVHPRTLDHGALRIQQIRRWGVSRAEEPRLFV